MTALGVDCKFNIRETSETTIVLEIDTKIIPIQATCRVDVKYEYFISVFEILAV